MLALQSVLISMCCPYFITPTDRKLYFELNDVHSCLNEAEYTWKVPDEAASVRTPSIYT
ncbi:uncharacterized protein PHALS_08589 [Plasmopara halstedii]|uniref:Uncharacterized protein n=1 Tax=Plasmopara halstedii TaxID=4781 RepID=A0A0P1AD68_PLAHL|nr:uncharacterized protein PHALS_08589 [Plasmopara halstedii]CEG38520.1 hypothetical protein PHALS_08589 [Plasmopara halstedii]|eukprot:XP_024574889.1 hypothetical protein PHALS_08589 [Plasmopara halstedii]